MCRKVKRAGAVTVSVVNAKASIKEFETQFPHKLRPTKKELTKPRKSANSTL
jgi:hypothetical protein